MKIGIFSDTHDNLQQVAKAIRVFQKERVELIIHCGDWVSPFVPQYIYSLEPKLTVPIKSVFGNNEGDHMRFLERKDKEGWNIEFKKDVFPLEVEDIKIAVYHGQNPLLTHALVSSNDFNVVFTGHTHEALNEVVGEVLHVNPGSTSGYSFGRITDKASIAIYDTQTKAARIVLLKDME